MRKNKNVAKKHEHIFTKIIVSINLVDYVIRRCKICHRCIKTRKDNENGA